MYANMSSLSIEQLFGVRGYVAVVTGGTSGLGFMISKVNKDARNCKRLAPHRFWCLKTKSHRNKEKFR